MVDKVVSGHFTHGKCIPPSMKAIIEMTTSPSFLSVTIWSGAQFRRATPYGMWYLALKPSVPMRESTRCLNLPINMVKLKGNG